MTTETDGPTATETYELSCNDCTFETTTSGSFFDALDVADAHQEEYRASPVEHFVDVERNGHE